MRLPRAVADAEVLALRQGLAVGALELPVVQPAAPRLAVRGIRALDPDLRLVCFDSVLSYMYDVLCFLRLVLEHEGIHPSRKVWKIISEQDHYFKVGLSGRGRWKVRLLP